MATTSQTLVQQPSNRKPWRHLALIAGLTFVVTPFALGFSVATGPSSHVQLPGVLMLLALALTCVIAFMHCPARPIWGKLAALVLALPSLCLTVYTVLLYLAFGLRR
jgi:hypothetical protein